MRTTHGGGELGRALLQMLSAALDTQPGHVQQPDISPAAPRSDGQKREEPSGTMSVTLRGHIDTANCGPIRFSLFGIELNAVSDQYGGVCGGSFDISRMPMNVPVRLVGRGGERMQVLATRLTDGVLCTVDDSAKDEHLTVRPFR